MFSRFCCREQKQITTKPNASPAINTLAIATAIMKGVLTQPEEESALTANVSMMMTVGAASSSRDSRDVAWESSDVVCFALVDFSEVIVLVLVEVVVLVVVSLVEREVR